jgi:hypothetical protein
VSDVEDNPLTQEAGGGRLLISVLDLDSSGNTEASEEMGTTDLPVLPLKSPTSVIVLQEGSEVE